MVLSVLKEPIVIRAECSAAVNAIYALLSEMLGDIISVNVHYFKAFGPPGDVKLYWFKWCLDKEDVK